MLAKIYSRFLFGIGIKTKFYLIAPPKKQGAVYLMSLPILQLASLN